MNSDDHVKYVHEVRQVIQGEPHRQVTQCDCSETCPNRQFFSTNSCMILNICQVSYLFVPQNDDYRVVDNGQDHNLQPDIIKLLCWID